MIEYQQAQAVPKETEVTVLSITNSGEDKYISSIGVSGSSPAEWAIYRDMGIIAKRKLTVPKPSLTIDMYKLKFNAGSTLEIKVVHFENNIQSFDAEVHINE